MLRQAGHLVDGIEVDDPTEVLSVNDRAQLASVEAELRDRINTHWMREGVTMVDPATTYVDAGVVLEPDVRILPNTMLGGTTVVKSGAVVGPDCDLVDTVVLARRGGPPDRRPRVDHRRGRDRRPVRLPAPGHPPRRPTCTSAPFVEIKNSEIGEGAKVPHLSYVGDADVGERTNIGAGNITANYDGRTKHRTRIGRDVQSGSNTVFVAPVEVGDGAYTGAGSVVNRDVPPGALAKGVPARIEEGWADRRDNADDDPASEERD